MGVKTGTKGAFSVGALVVGDSTNKKIRIFTNAGAPTNGTSGTLAGVAPAMSLLFDTTNKKIYQNLNTQASPTWVPVDGVAKAHYDFAVDGGAIAAITPAQSALLPANAIITNVIINSTVAVTSVGSATIAIGTTAGSSAASLLAATGKASFTLNGFVQGIPIPSDSTKFVKLSAAGSLNLTVATAALTAGVIDIWATYILGS